MLGSGARVALGCAARGHAALRSLSTSAASFTPALAARAHSVTSASPVEVTSCGGEDQEEQATKGGVEEQATHEEAERGRGSNDFLAALARLEETARPRVHEAEELALREGAARRGRAGARGKEEVSERRIKLRETTRGGRPSRSNDQ